mgnify:CR=1 FL=1
MLSNVNTDILVDAVAKSSDASFRSDTVAGYHLLGACIVAGRLDLAEKLVAGGFPIDLVNPGYVTTALSEASCYENIESVRWLLEHGANPNGYVTEDCSPLHHAAARDDLAIARALLVAGANPWIRDIAGRMPVEVARSDDMKRLLSEFRGSAHEFGSPVGKYQE